MKLEIRDKDHAAILDKHFQERTIVDFAGLSMAVVEAGVNYQPYRPRWTFTFAEVGKSRWNGEGHPPAGTICELKTESAGTWGRAEIMYSSPSAVVWRWEGLKDEFGSEWEVTRTRPLKTPEQIAEEERDKAILEMKKVFDSCSDELMPTSNKYLETLFGALYDAGYKA